MKLKHNNISRNNFEQCTKCTICTVYCPMLEVNPLYPGPKQAGPDGERYRLKEPLYYDEALKYCLNCKRCEVSCPSGVRIGDIIALARAKEGRRIVGLRDLTLANTDIVGSVATFAAPIVNGALGRYSFRKGLDRFLAIDHRRVMPKYAEEKFTTWYRREAAAAQESYDKRVTFFHGCYVNYNYPRLGKDVLTLFNALGYGVRLMEEERCCGLTKIANGLLASAARDAKHNLKAMRRVVEEGDEIVATSSSCCFALRDEYEHILGLDNSDVRDSVTLATRLIYRLLESGSVRVAFRKDFHMRAAYHSACHMEKLGWVIYSTSLLRLIPGLELEVLPSQCCGMAGVYGYKRENYDYSQAIGNALFDHIDKSGHEIVVTDCESCKRQIEMSTRARVVHPISVFVEALDVEATRRLNGVE